MRNMMNKVNEMMARVIAVTANKRGEGYIDLVVKILLSVVLGALILGALYALFNTQVLPSLSEKINAMFNYQG